MSKTKLQCRIIGPNGRVPTKTRDTDAAYDLYSAEEAFIPPHAMEHIKTDIQCAAPCGYYYSIDSRSGMLWRGIVALRGIIDATYTGEVYVVILNTSNDYFNVSIGDRVAQMVLHKTHDIEFEKVDEFDKEYDKRGEAGWGSSGV